MATSSFRQRLAEEWCRLTPTRLPQNASFPEALRHGLRQGAYGYFAPLRLLWWLLIRSWR